MNLYKARAQQRGSKQDGQEGVTVQVLLTSNYLQLPRLR
jgi:hypothetical protein